MSEHLGPLAERAETTVVCLVPDESVEHITYRTAPSTGLHAVDLLLLFAVALLEGRRNDYDGVVSISLIPYGCFALVIGRLYGLPTHLGIIGADLDVHARARYGTLVAALFRRFDAITVPGTQHERQLVQFGVPPERVTILANGVNQDVYQPNEDASTDYDYIWVGRFSDEKDPLLFVQTMLELQRRGEQPEAVMLGSGPLYSTVAEHVQALGLATHIDLPGWIDEPVNYYHRSAIFVLTSERDALPLTLLEAMATGLACVVPDVGNIRDAVTDGESGLILDTRNSESFATALQRLQSDGELYDRIATNAQDAVTRFSDDRAGEDWKKVLQTLQAEH